MVVTTTAVTSLLSAPSAQTAVHGLRACAPSQNLPDNSQFTLRTRRSVIKPGRLPRIFEGSRPCKALGNLHRPLHSRFSERREWLLCPRATGEASASVTSDEQEKAAGADAPATAAPAEQTADVNSTFLTDLRNRKAAATAKKIQIEKKVESLQLKVTLANAAAEEAESALAEAMSRAEENLAELLVAETDMGEAEKELAAALKALLATQGKSNLVTEQTPEASPVEEVQATAASTDAEVLPAQLSSRLVPVLLPDSQLAGAESVAESDEEAEPESSTDGAASSAQATATVEAPPANPLGDTPKDATTAAKPAAAATVTKAAGNPLATPVAADSTQMVDGALLEARAWAVEQARLTLEAAQVRMKEANRVKEGIEQEGLLLGKQAVTRREEAVAAAAALDKAEAELQAAREEEASLVTQLMQPREELARELGAPDTSPAQADATTSATTLDASAARVDGAATPSPPKAKAEAAPPKEAAPTPAPAPVSMLTAKESGAVASDVSKQAEVVAPLLAATAAVAGAQAGVKAGGSVKEKLADAGATGSRESSGASSTTVPSPSPAAAAAKASATASKAAAAVSPANIFAKWLAKILRVAAAVAVAVAAMSVAWTKGGLSKVAPPPVVSAVATIERQLSSPILMKLRKDAQSTVQHLPHQVEELLGESGGGHGGHSMNDLYDVLWLLLASVVAVPLFQKLPGGSPVLGYLAAGALIGPHALSIIHNVEGTRELAEFGVVFLLFNIGLELSLERLQSMQKYVFGLGSLQVLASTAAIALATSLTNACPMPGAIIVGGAMALSSTAVGLQVLAERKESQSRHGRAAFSVLLFQDLAVVVLLMLIPLLAPSGAASPSFASISKALGAAAVKAVLGIGVIIYGGRTILRPLYRQIAENRNAEIFAATTLLVCLGTSLLTAQAGLSMALGAFLAGLLLAETEFALQVESDIAPYRGLLLGLFFMTVGMSIDASILVQQWPLILSSLTALLVGKTLLVTAMGVAIGLSPIAAARTGLILSSGGEFAFVAFGESVSKGLMSPTFSSQMFLVVALSMAVTPYLGALGQWIENKFAKKEDMRSLQPVDAEVDDLRNHIIIAGYGRVGQMIAELLNERMIQFVALDVRSDRVSAGRAQGNAVYFGDAGSPAVLHSIGASRAAAVVITLDTPGANYRAVYALAKHYPGTKIYVRAHDVDHGIILEKAGATAVVPETLEPSLQLASALLKEVDVPDDDIVQIISNFRKRHMAELSALKDKLAVEAKKGKGPGAAAPAPA
eukprot:jgi/Mesvir1/28262/Mv04795-RA.8